MAETTTLITKKRREILRNATATGAAVKKITHIAFGSGGVDTDGKVKTISPDATGLVAKIGQYDAKLTTESGVPTTTARYTATIPAADLPGVKISEAALVDESGVVCAIKNMYVKQKDAGVVFTFTFDDEF